MMGELKKLYNKIMFRIFYLMTKGQITGVTNSEPTQRLKQSCLAFEDIPDIERFEEYGITSYPLEGAETFSNFLSGNREQGIVICVHDSRYRPTDLASGDVCIYTYKDKSVKHRIHLKASDGSISIYGNTTLTGNITVTGDVSDSSGTAQTMAAMRSKYNAHTHGGAVPVPNAGEQM
jgi:phage gp45-like